MCTKVFNVRMICIETNGCLLMLLVRLLCRAADCCQLSDARAALVTWSVGHMWRLNTLLAMQATWSLSEFSRAKTFPCGLYYTATYINDWDVILCLCWLCDITGAVAGFFCQAMVSRYMPAAKQLLRPVWSSKWITLVELAYIAKIDPQHLFVSNWSEQRFYANEYNMFKNDSLSETILVCAFQNTAQEHCE